MPLPDAKKPTSADPVPEPAAPPVEAPAETVSTVPDAPEPSDAPESRPPVSVKLNPDFDAGDGDVVVSVANHEDIKLTSSAIDLPGEVAELVLSSPAAVKAE